MALVWLPWGLICIFSLDAINAVIGVSSQTAHGSTDIRAMYGGFQTAVGIMALLALYNNRFFPNFVFSLAFLCSCLALSRTYGLIVDQSGGIYTYGVVAFEYFSGITSIAWLILLPRIQNKVSGSEVANA